MIKTSLYISIFLLVFNCNPSEISEEEEYIPQGKVLRVNSYTETCQGLIEMQCLLVQEGDQIGTYVYIYRYGPLPLFVYPRRLFRRPCGLFYLFPNCVGKALTVGNILIIGIDFDSAWLCFVCLNVVIQHNLIRKFQ